MDPYRDLALRCTGCSGLFTWTVGEQKYFEARGFQTPRRCPGCRAQRKTAEASAGGDVPRTDRTLTCRDCGEAFVFTAFDQHAYRIRGYANPIRCLTCRHAVRARRQDGTSQERSAW